MAEQYRFANIVGPITCHAWNKDKTGKYCIGYHDVLNFTKDMVCQCFIFKTDIQ